MAGVLGSAAAIGRPFLDQRLRDVGPGEVRTPGLIAVENLTRSLDDHEVWLLGNVELVAPDRNQLVVLALAENAGLVEDRAFTVNSGMGKIGFEFPPRHRAAAAALAQQAIAVS